MSKKKNGTEIYGEGYLAGYNQCRVDHGFLTQEDADVILKKIKSSLVDESECDDDGWIKKEDWAYVFTPTSKEGGKLIKHLMKIYKTGERVKTKESENKIEKKKQSFPEIPEVEVYVKFHELKRVIKEVERGAKDCVMTKEKDGIDFTPDMENSEAKVKATIGFHHLLPHMEAIINYMKKKKKYDEEN